MKKQILGLVLLAAFLASLMIVSAGLTLTLVAPQNVSYTARSAIVTFNLAYTIDNATINATNITLSGSNLASFSSASTMINGTNQNITANLTFSPFQSSISVAASGNATLTNGTLMPFTLSTSLPVINTAMCSVSNPGDLAISSIEFNVLDGFGDDEDYWYPLDEVEVSFDVDNDGTGDIRNIAVTACLVDTDAGDGECIIDEEDMDLSDDEFDLDSKDDTPITMKFALDPDYFTAGDTSYILYIAVNGEVDDSGDANDGNDTCTSDSQSIEIRTDEQFVILKDIVASDLLSCGSSMQITADLWNIGDEDIDSDEVFIEAYNKELGIDKVIGIDSDLDSMEKQEITMDLALPKEYAEKAYTIQFTIFDDEDAADNDVYQNSEDDEAVFNTAVSLKKCPSSTSSDASVSVSAELSDDTPKSIIGEQFVVEATIKNTGTSSSTYTINVSGNEAWSKVSSIEPNTFTLAAGESKKVSIYFDVNSNAKAGEKEFIIKTSYGSKFSEQKVLVTLEEGLSSSKILQNIKENSFIYSIVLINIILLIAIIIIVVKMFGRKNED